MREEMDAHLAQATSRLMARGLTRAEAERAARREFGGRDSIEEAARDARGARWIETTAADVRFALRQFRRTPMATITMLLVLALGIGANIALFTVLHSMLTMPAPGIPRDDALVRIRGINRESFRTEEVAAFERQTDVFADVAASARDEIVALDVGGTTEGLVSGAAMYVTDDYFDVLGVRPLLGTTLSVARSGRDASALVALIGHDLWQTQYGAAQSVIGRSLKVNDTPVTIVGVLPPRFVGTERVYYRSQVWMPADAHSAVSREQQQAELLWGLVARLRPGVSQQRAEVAVKSLAERMARGERYARRPADRRPTADVAPLLGNNHYAQRDRETLFVGAASSAITLLILLITCTNVSALLVGMAVARRREIAVRLSLGAARRRVVRQLVTESALLALAAGSLGVLVIAVLLRLFGTYVPEIQVVLSWPVLVFTFGFAIATGVIFGLTPALHATRLTVADVLKDAGPAVSHARTRLQRALIVTQIALTQPLLVGLGALIVLLVGTMAAQERSPLEDRIMTITFSSAGRVRASGQTQDEARAAWMRDMQRMRERLAALPGVTGAVYHANYGISMSETPYHIHAADRVEGAWGDRPLRLYRGEPISPGWFEVMGIPITAGRDFAPPELLRDTAGIIIGSDLAQLWFGKESALGRRIVRDESNMRRDYHPAGPSERVIIGVIDERAAGPAMTPEGARVYVPVNHRVPTGSSVRLRTFGPAQAMVPTIRKVALAEAPNTPINSITTLSAERAAEARGLMLVSGAAGAGGLLALFLSAIGLYALVSLGVTQRRREIGIRTALGADRGDVINLFFAGGLKLSLLGLLLGLPLSLFALRTLQRYNDDAQISIISLAALVVLCVIVVASLAAWIPARRAALVNPLDTLRDAG